MAILDMSQAGRPRSSPSPSIRRLLRLMAWAEAANVKVKELEANLPPSFGAPSTASQRCAAKSRHRELYKAMVSEVRKILEALDSLRAGSEDLKHGLRIEHVPSKALDCMWRVALAVANTMTPIYKVIKAQGLFSLFNYIKKYPLVWREIWNHLGLGWSGKQKTAPPELLTRARMRKGAEMCVSGFTMAYAARQMGLSSGAIVGLRRLYPEYWEFLCQQVRREKGLAKGQHLAVQVINERGQVIVGVQRGMGRHVRRKLRAAHGIRRPRYGRVLQGTPPGGDDSGVWSKPMTKTKMMTALGIDSSKTFNKFAAQQGIRQAGSRQIHQLNLNGLTPEQRDKLSRA